MVLCVQINFGALYERGHLRKRRLGLSLTIEPLGLRDHPLLGGNLRPLSLAEATPSSKSRIGDSKLLGLQLDANNSVHQSISPL